MRPTFDTDGNIKINVIDLFDQMDEEAKQEIVEQFAWQSPIWDELRRGICEEYAAEHFNRFIYKMRLAFFQSEDAPAQLRYTVKSLLDTIRHQRDKLREVEKRNGEWRHWYNRNMPASRTPVPFPRIEWERTGTEELDAFLERNGMLDVLEPTRAQAQPQEE